MNETGAAVSSGDDQPDEFQQRYLSHQKRKAETLKIILAERHSDRMYADTPVDNDTIMDIMKALVWAPSSCDRGGISPTLVLERDRKALLGGLLVGGVGWIHRAPVVVLLFADESAYKAPGELDSPICMHALDAGIAAGQMWLQATALGLAVAYCNPNIRPINQDHFRRVFGAGLFCGALAVGWPHPDSPDREHAAERVRDAPELKAAAGEWVAPTDYIGLDTLNVEGPDIIKNIKEDT